jgi:hypothetical protein
MPSIVGGITHSAPVVQSFILFNVINFPLCDSLNSAAFRKFNARPAGTVGKGSGIDQRIADAHLWLGLRISDDPAVFGLSKEL